MDESGELLIGILTSPEPDIVRVIDLFLERSNARIGKPGTDRWEIPVREWQRLEFLGDRVINLIAAEMLFSRDTTLDEGAMTKILGGIVSNEGLGLLARELDDRAFRRFIPLAIGELNTYGERIRGGAFEAFIGALYGEFGFDGVSHFMRSLLEDRLNQYVLQENPINLLQEYYQKKKQPLPVYRETGRSGPDHAPVFTVRIETADGSSSTGSGPSLSKASKDAARSMAKNLGLLPAGNNETRKNKK